MVMLSDKVIILFIPQFMLKLDVWVGTQQGEIGNSALGTDGQFSEMNCKLGVGSMVLFLESSLKLKRRAPKLW